MFEKLAIFRLAQGLAEHAARRQSVISENVANADTPGYRARELVPFQDMVDRAGVPGPAMRSTRPGHFGSLPSGISEVSLQERGSPQSPNGNAVSIELEMMKAADARQQHELALSIYSSSLNILRASFGRPR